MALTYNHIFCTNTVKIAIFMLFMWKSNLSLVGGFLKGKTKPHAFPVIKYLNEQYPRCRTLNSNFCLLSPPSPKLFGKFNNRIWNFRYQSKMYLKAKHTKSSWFHTKTFKITSNERKLTLAWQILLQHFSELGLIV